VIALAWLNVPVFAGRAPIFMRGWTGGKQAEDK
jgi:hypothetical protein